MERIIEYRTDRREKILRVSCREDVLAENLYQLKMINTNQPTGLLPVHPSRDSGGTWQIYDITGLRSLKDSEGEEVQVDYLYSLITAMAREADVLAEFLLDPDKLLLTPETIFFKPWAGEVWFCYDPGKEETLQESLRQLMEYFLKKLDPKDEEDILFMYGLYQRTREPMVTLTSFHDFFLENRERYLKIGEERERKQQEKQAADAEREERMAAERLMENSLYDELGLEKTERTVSFPFLKKNRELSEAPEISLDLDRFRDRSSVRKEGPQTWETVEIEEEKQVPEPASERKDLDPRALIGRLRPFGFELTVGSVVLAGVILYFAM